MGRSKFDLRNVKLRALLSLRLGKSYSRLLAYGLSLLTASDQLTEFDLRAFVHEHHDFCQIGPDESSQKFR